MSHWGKYFMDIAAVVATKSKDPSTKVGAVIVRPDNTIASTGFNGFPREMHDTSKMYEDRDYKLAHVIHAEMNAILFAKEDITGYTMYVTMYPCSVCALHLAQSGIKRIVTYEPSDAQMERWKDSFEKSKRILEECGVEVVLKRVNNG